MRCMLQGGLVCMVVMYREIYEQTHVNSLPVESSCSAKLANNQIKTSRRKKTSVTHARLGPLTPFKVEVKILGQRQRKR